MLILTSAAACALSVIGIVAAVAIECVVVAVHSSIVKVENLLGVDGHTHETGLEVEMWASAATSVATECDRGSSFDILVFLNKEFREVAIDGFEAIVVSQNHVESVAVALKFG